MDLCRRVKCLKGVVLQQLHLLDSLADQARDGPDIVTAIRVKVLHGGIPPGCYGQLVPVCMVVACKPGDIASVIFFPADLSQT